MSAGMTSSAGPTSNPIASRAPANADVPERCMPKTRTPMHQNYLWSLPFFQWNLAAHAVTLILRATYDIPLRCRAIGEAQYSERDGDVESSLSRCREPAMCH